MSLDNENVTVTVSEKGVGTDKYECKFKSEDSKKEERTYVCKDDEEFVVEYTSYGVMYDYQGGTLFDSDHDVIADSCDKNTW